jgi:hypothetical protein
MQLTRFDRWLRTRFVNETHIYTLREPPEIPPKISCEELPTSPGRQYRFRYVSRNPRAADALIKILKDNSQMFTTRIVDRKAWFVHLLAPERASATWRIVWIIISLFSAVEVGLCVRKLWANPEFQKNVQDALKTIRR